MSLSVDFSGALSGVTFVAGTATVADLLNLNPGVPISLPFLPGPAPTSDNLTSLGLLTAGGDTVWRITNVGAAATATLSEFGGVFSQILSLPANTLTYVRAGAAGTYQLTGDIGNTKASGSQIVSSIRTLPNNASYFITGSGFNDNLTSGISNDTIIGGAGDDTLSGLNGADSLEGGTESDSLSGGAGIDTLIGGTGSDTLIGGTGNDILTGGSGSDSYTYTATNQGSDTITNFSIAEGDRLAFTAAAFGLPVGNLNATLFGSSAGGTVRFVYSGGTLSFDLDATTTGVNLTQIATLTGAPAITNAQIFII